MASPSRERPPPFTMERSVPDYHQPLHPSKLPVADDGTCPEFFLAALTRKEVDLITRTRQQQARKRCAEGAVSSPRNHAAGAAARSMRKRARISLSESALAARSRPMFYSAAGDPGQHPRESMTQYRARLELTKQRQEEQARLSGHRAPVKQSAPVTQPSTKRQAAAASYPWRGHEGWKYRRGTGLVTWVFISPDGVEYTGEEEVAATLSQIIPRQPQQRPSAVTPSDDTMDAPHCLEPKHHPCRRSSSRAR